MENYVRSEFIEGNSLNVTFLNYYMHNGKCFHEGLFQVRYLEG